MKLYDQKLIELYGGIAQEKQAFFCKYSLQNNLDYRIVDDKSIYFGNNNTDFPLQVLGVHYSSTNMWTWEWANTAGTSVLPDHLIEHSKRLKELGGKNGVKFLSTGQFEIDRDDLHYIGLVALGHFNSSGYCLADYSAGAMCITVNADAINKHFPNDHNAIFTVFPQLVSGYEFNHREAFANYLGKKHYKVDRRKNEVIGTKGKHKVKAVFDDGDRLTELK